MRVAAFQCKPLTADISANLRRLERTTRGAATLGADVLVLPEMYLTGYALGDRLGALAMLPDAPHLESVSEIASASGVAIVLGYPERRNDGIFNVAGMWQADGTLSYRYAKRQLFGPEEKRQFRPGRSHEVVGCNGHKAGLLICYDVEFPEPSRCLAQMGAEIIFAPTANMHPYVLASEIQPVARALENGVAMVYVNYVGTEGTLTYTGRSLIAGSNGEVLARAGGTSECLLIADLPMQSSDRSTQLHDLSAIDVLY